MRIVLDTDEERFGGHCRLEEGHGKPLPSGGPTHNRRFGPRIYYRSLLIEFSAALGPS